MKLVLIAFAIVCLSSCQNTLLNNASKSKSAQSSAIENKLKARDVIVAFKKANLPIDKVFFYTAETDFENLLGKPDQYIEKVDWIDTRIKSNSIDNHVGGVIEIFETVDALESRKKKVEEVESKAGIKNYLFAHKNVLIRLDSILNPQQASDYEIVLKTVY